MIHAYAYLAHLLLFQPWRVGWLAAHAWRWHKGPLATFLFSVIATSWGISEMVRITKAGKES